MVAYQLQLGGAIQADIASVASRIAGNKAHALADKVTDGEAAFER